MRTIDADALIDYIQMMPIDLGYREVEEIEGYVGSMPTIEPEREKARWVKMSDADGIFYACSECGEWHGEISNFCPNCGAEMKGKVDGRDDTGTEQPDH